MQQQPKRPTTEQRRQAVRDECNNRRIRIEPTGKAFHLTGAGVDMLVADLALVDLRSLEPVME